MKNKLLHKAGRIFLWISVCCLMFATCGCSENKSSEGENSVARWDGSLKILAIGNSFSDDSLEYVYQLASGAGIQEIKLGILYIGGCSIDMHVGNAQYNRPAYDFRMNTQGVWNTTSGFRMKDALEGIEWDFIMFQQASGDSGVESSYEKLGELIDYVEETAAGSPCLVWNMTWAYQPYTPMHPQFIRYDNDQMTMYKAIVDAVKSQVENRKEISTIIPTGTAIQNARTSFVGDTLTRDGYHLNFLLGRYIAGLTVFHRLTGLPIDDAEPPDGMTENERQMAIESAKNAALAPYAVTESVYKIEENS